MTCFILYVQSCCCPATPLNFASGGSNLPRSMSTSQLLHPYGQQFHHSAGFVHKSRGDNVLPMRVQLKRWRVSCGWVLQRGLNGAGYDLASTLCKYDFRKNDLFVLERVWRVRRGSISSELLMCAQYFVIASWRSYSLISFRHECWVCDGCEVKQPLQLSFYFNEGKISIVTSPIFSNKSVKLVLSLPTIPIWTLTSCCCCCVVDPHLHDCLEVSFHTLKWRAIPFRFPH